jgi:hypothetical protein
MGKLKRIMTGSLTCRRVRKVLAYAVNYLEFEVLDGMQHKRNHGLDTHNGVVLLAGGEGGGGELDEDIVDYKLGDGQQWRAM